MKTVKIPLEEENSEKEELKNQSESSINEEPYNNNGKSDLSL